MIRIPGYWQLQQKIKDLEFKRVARKLNLPTENHQLIFADPRGGSTWITEILSKITAHPVIWEPLLISKSPVFKKLGFTWRQFIPEDESWPEAKAAFDQLFAGKILNHWMGMQTNPQALLKAEKLIIKFCRANQLLPWITKYYNLKYKPLYLIRHPFAVVSSQLKQGGWSKNFDGYDIPKGPFNEFYTAHADFLKSIKTKEESLTATWCLCNQIPLNHPNNNKAWMTINYEDLILEPKKCLTRVLTEWGVDYDLDKIDFNKKSTTTTIGSPISGQKQIEYWTKELSPDQVARMNNVLEYFGIEAYSKKPQPEINYR